MKEYIANYLQEMIVILERMLDGQMPTLEKMVKCLDMVKRGRARVFFIGVGGAAGTGSHATNDFNKIAGIASICLTDNPSLFSALANDEGFDSVFVRQLEMHQFNHNDCLFVFSVGGGSDTTSKNLKNAIMMAKDMKATVLGVVGRDSGYTAKYADAAIVVPIVAEERVTPHSESFQLAIEHLLANALVNGGGA